jgi:hypothetical protein
MMLLFRASICDVTTHLDLTIDTDGRFSLMNGEWRDESCISSGGQRELSARVILWQNVKKYKYVFLKQHQILAQISHEK